MLTQGLPPEIMIDIWSEFLVAALGLFGGVQILRKTLQLFHLDQILRNFLEKKRKLRVERNTLWSPNPQYFRIAERILLILRKLESFILSELPGAESLLKLISQFQSDVDHELQQELNRRGRK
jgi:hypothetical protein